MHGAIRTAIIEKLQGLVEESDSPLAAAYRTPRSQVEGTPFAVVSPSERQADFASTGSVDRLTFVFVVHIYNRLTNEDTREAEELFLENCVDDVLMLFAQRNALDPACDWVAPVPGAWSEETVADGVYLKATITLNCVKYTG